MRFSHYLHRDNRPETWVASISPDLARDARAHTRLHAAMRQGEVVGGQARVLDQAFVQWRVQAFCPFHKVHIVVNGTLLLCKINDFDEDPRFGPRLKPAVLFLIRLQVAEQVLHVRRLPFSIVRVDDNLVTQDPLGLIVQFVFVKDFLDPVICLRYLRGIQVFAGLDVQSFCCRFGVATTCSKFG